jgi:hypothetical protein
MQTIRHIVPLDDLLVLTSSGAWKIGADNSDVLRLVATLDDPVCAPCVRAERGVSAGQIGRAHV